MADPISGNSFTEDQEALEPSHEVSDIPATENYYQNTSEASAPKMQRSRSSEKSALHWANGAIPDQGLVDPGTLPQLTSGCYGMSITSWNYLIHWQSHADSRTAWDYINPDLGIENYVKIYTSQNF